MRRALLALAPIIAIAIAVIVLTWGHSATETAKAAIPGPATMSLVMKDGGSGEGICDSNQQPFSVTPVLANECRIDELTPFTLSVELKNKPETGYGGFQTLVTWTGWPTKDRLIYINEGVGEIVWPDCVFDVQSADTNEVAHGCTTAVTTPLNPVSFHKGNLVDLTFFCWPGIRGQNIRFHLISFNQDPRGAALILKDGSVVSAPPATLDILCVPPKRAFPGDMDGDGCPDRSENRPKSEVANGGGRDWLNPWDYYDVNGDGVINLFDDILGVIQHFSLDGLGQYDVTYDRGPSAGPNPWNMTAPDGQINLFTDILGVIRQFTLEGCT